MVFIFPIHAAQHIAFAQPKIYDAEVAVQIMKSFATIKPVCPIEMAPKGPVYTDPQN